MIKEANARDKLVEEVDELHFLLTRMSKHKAFELFNFWRFSSRRIGDSRLLLIHQCSHHLVTKVRLD